MAVTLNLTDDEADMLARRLAGDIEQEKQFDKESASKRVRLMESVYTKLETSSNK